MSGAVGKPATLGGIGGGLGISKEGEPELRRVGAEGKPAAEGGLPMLGAGACTEDRDGDGGEDEAKPSTWSKMVCSYGKAGDANFCFFMTLVIIGEMTRLLRI